MDNTTPASPILFTAQGGPREAVEVARHAQREFEGFQAETRVRKNNLTAEQLKSNLEQMAPVLRALMYRCDCYESTITEHGGSETNGYVAETPVLFLHFALTALAFIESQQQEAKA